MKPDARTANITIDLPAASRLLSRRRSSCTLDARQTTRDERDEPSMRFATEKSVQAGLDRGAHQRQGLEFTVREIAVTAFDGLRWAALGTYGLICERKR